MYNIVTFKSLNFTTNDTFVATTRVRSTKLKSKYGPHNAIISGSGHRMYTGYYNEDNTLHPMQCFSLFLLKSATATIDANQ